MEDNTILSILDDTGNAKFHMHATAFLFSCIRQSIRMRVEHYFIDIMLSQANTNLNRYVF